MNIACWLAATAKLRPEAPALLTGFDLDADYKTFARRAAAIGAGLARDFRIAPGDRVALFASNCTQYLECLYGIWWMGAVAIPINAKLHGREAAWICGDAGAKLTFVSDDTIEALAEVKGDLPADMKMLSVDSDVYPGQSDRIPRDVWRNLLQRFEEQLAKDTRNADFRGSLVDENMFAIDTKEWGLANLLQQTHPEEGREERERIHHKRLAI